MRLKGGEILINLGYIQSDGSTLHEITNLLTEQTINQLSEYRKYYSYPKVPILRFRDNTELDEWVVVTGVANLEGGVIECQQGNHLYTFIINNERKVYVTVENFTFEQ